MHEGMRCEVSFSMHFPIEGSFKCTKCRQLRRFQIFVPSFPSFGRGFDSHRPLQIPAKFTLIRLPLLTSHTPFCTPRDPVLRPFCAQKYSTRNCEETHEAAFSREAC